MDPTARAIERLRIFARPMNPELPAVDVALADVRNLLHDSGVPFKLVGGVAVVHHGYARTTEDIDLLVDPRGLSRLWEELSSHGFARVSPNRLRHLSTGVRVNLLVAGTPMPRPESGTYPAPDSLEASGRDADVVGLPGLFELKLRSRRHRDEADVVELLKRLDEAHFLEVEAAVPAELRAYLATLRNDALEELARE